MRATDLYPTRTLALPCPVVTPDGGDCAGTVAVVLESEPGDRRWGSDADGRRGVRVPGRWTVAEVVPCCTEGHELTDAHMQRLTRDALDWRGEG